MVDKGMSIRQAAIKLKINYSTAKHNMKNMDNSSGQTSYKHLPKKRMASHMFHASGSDSDMLDGEEYKVGKQRKHRLQGGPVAQRFRDHRRAAGDGAKLAKRNGDNAPRNAGFKEQKEPPSKLDKSRRQLGLAVACIILKVHDQLVPPSLKQNDYSQA